MKHVSIRSLIGFILVLSILTLSAAAFSTTANGEVNSITDGVSGEYEELGLTFWNGYTDLSLQETGEIDTLVIEKRLTHGMGSSINFSYADYPYLDPKRTVIKLSRVGSPSILSKGTVYNYYKTAHYCIVPVTTLGELYLDVEAYDSNNIKHFRRIKVISQ